MIETVLKSFSWANRVSDMLVFICLYGALLLAYKPRDTWKASLIAGVFFFLLGNVSLLVVEQLSGKSVAGYIFNFTLWGIAYSLLFVRGAMPLKLVLSLLLSASWVQIIQVSSTLSLLATPLLGPDVAFIRTRLFSVLVFIVASVFLCKNSIITNRRVPLAYWLTMVLVILLGMLFTLSAPVMRIDRYDYFNRILYSGGALLIEYAIFWLAKVLIEKSEKDLLHVAYARQRQSEGLLAMESIRLVDDFKARQHDMDNFLGLLSALIESRKTEQAQALLSEMISKKHTRSDEISSGNTVVDVILNQHLGKTAAMAVPFEVDACLSESLTISSLDLCSLLSNMLDNALEASIDAASPAVKVTIRPTKDYLLLQVSNAVAADVLKKNPELATTKADSDKHGLGIKIIRKITEKYQGMCSFEMQDGVFVAKVLLGLAADE